MYHWFSCQKKSVAQQLKLIEELEFSPDFNIKSKLVNVKGEDYICFYDFVTHKKIVAEGLSNGDKLTINLSQVLEETYKIAAFDLVSWDTIYVLADYSTKLFVINRQGEIINTIDFNPYLLKEGHFELMSTPSEFIFNDTSMIFALEFRPESLPEHLQDNLRAYDSAMYRSPRLFKVDNFYKDSMVTHFGTRNLYCRFSAEDVLVYDTFNFRLINGDVFFTSWYTDSIYIIDPVSLKVKNSIKIRSKYTGLIADHLTREVAQADNERFMYNIKSNGQIFNINYDQMSQHYFLSIIHKPKSLKEIPNWSFVILDSLFNQVDEIKMDSKKYRFNFFSGRDGLFIISNAGHETEDGYHKKAYYSMFRYE